MSVLREEENSVQMPASFLGASALSNGDLNPPESTSRQGRRRRADFDNDAPKESKVFSNFSY